MPCYISCALATIFVIASIFTTNACQKNKTIQQYQSQLPANLQNIYQKEKLNIRQVFLEYELYKKVFYYNDDYLKKIKAENAKNDNEIENDDDE